MSQSHVSLSAAIWRKSSRSGQQGQCVEVAGVPGLVGVRDSKNPAGAKLAFTRSSWRAFAATAKAGGHDL